jgi:hypothetical protein
MAVTAWCYCATFADVMFASNFDGLLPLVFGIPIALLVLAILSLIPAFRGHLVSVLLAIPPIFFGGMMVWAMIADGRSSSAGVGPEIVLFSSPLVVGVLSVVVWAIRRRF